MSVDYQITLLQINGYSKILINGSCNGLAAPSHQLAKSEALGLVYRHYTLQGRTSAR